MVEIILAVYLFAIAVSAIFLDSYYFRKVITFPFWFVFLVFKLLLAIVSFGKFKIPLVKRSVSRRWRQAQIEAIDPTMKKSDDWSSGDDN
jgi:hypothetical protein